ncbi:MAG: adenosylcobinamide-GDP ribazoletransferase [Betaproteobacteria bacterium]|jgi:adenosylcobinamide-GDP ribazoletransferase|nr:adenosylcobinamide-GDP ribazoletransferase [Betaproteobacteria bacterium]
MIGREAGRLLAAASFLTRLPVGRPRSEDELGRSARYFPLVGAGVGALGVAVLLAAIAALPLVVAVILSVVATALVTGALHEDGLADTCDALGGGRTREETLRILQDPRIGAYGALGLFLAVALKISALAYLPLALLPAALVCAHAASRAACVALIAFGTYARAEGGKARPVAHGARSIDAVVALVIGVAPFALAPFTFLWALPGVLALTVGLYAWFRARLGGYTGDCLGATQQLTEIACYLAFLAVL